MADLPPRTRGLLDTSVVVDLGSIPPSELPVEMAVAAITMAELAAGTHATADPLELAERQRLLQQVESTFDVIAFGIEAARAYGLVWTAVTVAGRKPRGARAVDLLIAATAVASGLPLWTRNPSDFAGLESVLDVRTI